MKRIRPRTYRELLREDRSFPKLPKTLLDDVKIIVGDCPCNPEDILDQPGTDAMVDAYELCGSNCGDEAPGPFYLRKPASGSNPPVIRVKFICSNMRDACFSLAGEVPVSETEGPVLTMGMYEELPEGACEEGDCNSDDSCPIVKFVICEESLKAYNNFGGVAAFPREVFVLREALGGKVLGTKIKVGLACYKNANIPCLRTAPPGAKVITSKSEFKFVSACTDQKCECCDNVGKVLDTLATGVKERAKWINGGVLPSPPGHDFTDPDYLLNKSSVVDADCKMRCERWRLYLCELDYWLTTFYLSQRWVNTETHPDGDLTGAETVTHFHMEYYEDIQGPPSVDWFLNVFGTTGLGEKYTIGGEGGFGKVNFAKFGDHDPHIIVEQDVDLEQFCKLMVETADRMMRSLQALMGVDVAATLTDSMQGGGDSGDAWGENGCALAKQGMLDLWNYAKDHGWLWNDILTLQLGSLESTYKEVGDPPEDPSGWHFDAMLRRWRSRVSVSLTAYTGSANVYLKLVPYGNSSNPPSSPDIPVDSMYHRLSETQAGGVWTSEMLNDDDSPPEFTSDCPLGRRNGGWYLADSRAVILGNFIV